jgi:hypothetical protein
VADACDLVRYGWRGVDSEDGAQLAVVNKRLLTAGRYDPFASIR